MTTITLWTVFDCGKKCPYMWEMHPEMFGEYCAYNPLSKRRHTHIEREKENGVNMLT